MTKISTHFLRRRAEAKRESIRRAQKDALSASGRTAAAARERLTVLGVGPTDRILISKRGKWDARYDVTAE